MDDINWEQQKQLTEIGKNCQKTVCSLPVQCESLLQKATETTGDSEHSVVPPLVDDVTKQLKDSDLALESTEQQPKLALKQYLSTGSDLPTSVDRTAIQSDDNQEEDGKVMINQQVELSDDSNGQTEANLNTIAPEPQAPFPGTLPDDVYLHLMSVMGIQECLVSNRLVCRLWNDLVLERCHNQKSLKLFATFDNLMEYGEMLLDYEKTDDPSLLLKSIGDDLLFEELETNHGQPAASKILTALFPKVEELVLCTQLETLLSIEHLLQFYAKQLTSLTMTNFVQFDDQLEDTFLAFSFPLLKSLNTLNFSLKEDQLLSHLPQLESLSLSGTESSLEALLRTGTQLEELSINWVERVYTAPVDTFSRRPPVSSKLRKFAFQRSRNDLQVLEFISVNLTSLQCLKLRLKREGDNVAHIHSLTSFLVRLTQLHSLTLDAPVSSFLLTDNQLAEIQPLATVRQLKLLLSDYDSPTMDLFSRVLFTAFPKVEQILLAFTISVDTGTLAAFEDFARKHANVVKLFRSKEMSKCTALPNLIGPLLGRHGQLYQEYIAEEELFGVRICQLDASLLSRRQGEDGPNLKSTLRPADSPLAAVSTLCRLLESRAFSFLSLPTESNFRMAATMQNHMLTCALNCGPSEAALFVVTCKCVLFLLDCSPLQAHLQQYTGLWKGTYLDFLLCLVEHYQVQQFKEADLLLQLHHSMDKLIEEMLDTHQFESVIKEVLLCPNGVRQVETARALLRVCDKASDY